MLGYAQSRPRIAARSSSPNTMLVVIVVHVTLIALVMSAKMDLPQKIIDGPLLVDLIHEPTPPPPNPAEQPRQPVQPTLSQPQSVVPTPPTSAEIVDSSPTPIPSGELVGSATAPQPFVEPLTPPAPVRRAARLLTSGADLKPAYPAAKLMTGEEADLRLKLTIDAGGRVVAVEPIGRADPVFLAAARRHLIARWRFAPATEDGRALVSSTIITLRFRLD